MGTKGKPLDATEEAVRLRLESIIGANVRQLDDNTAPSMPDLEIVYADRDPAPIEVTSNIDGARRATTESKGWTTLEAGALRRSWILASMGNPDWRKVRLHVEDYLLVLEQANIDEFGPATRSSYVFRAMTGDSTYVRVLEALDGLLHLELEQGNSYVATSASPSINVGLGSGHTWNFTADDVPGWVSDFVNASSRQDNVRKLDRSGAEAHLAIEVPLTGADPAIARALIDEYREHLLPVEEPSVPDSITDIWLSASFEHHDVLHWHRAGGWTRHVSTTA